MVIRDGKALLSASYGLASLETATACNTETNYRLASVSKQFTAMAIMVLAERGKLSLDDPVTKFFSKFPACGREITIRRMLTHTSGLLAYEDLIPPARTTQVHDRDVLELLCRQDRTMFAPGSQFHYSNSGFVLLGLIAAEASEQTFAQFLHDNIFQPLGMKNTLAFEEGISTVPHRALGYAAVVDDTTKRRVFNLSDQSITSATLGDGGIYSSIADLFQWDQALYTEKLVSRRMLREAFTAHSTTSDFEHSGYGFGWYVGSYKGVPSVWHYGGTCGFSTHIERYPEKKLSLIVLTNRRSAPLTDISHSVIDLYLA